MAGAWESTRNYPVAAIWDSKLGPREIGVLPGGILSEAYGLNDLGQVVGWSESFNGNNAFLWDGSQMIDLGSGFAADINNAGTIVGALILTVLDSLLTIVNASQATRQILYGLIILALAAIYARASAAD